MSAFRFGCGKQFTTWIPRGFTSREITVRCGTTAYNGGVNQCDECERRIDAGPLPDVDEGDLEFDQRVFGGGE